MSEGERIKGNERIKKGVGVERWGGEGQGRTTALTVNVISPHEANELPPYGPHE